MRLRRWIGSLGTAGMLAVIGFLVLPGSEDRLLAQNRKNFSVISEDSGHVALGLAIRRLGVVGTFMQAPAHPDDETNALFALFTLGQGMRSIDVQNNRGEGGQNEIGPELFRDIGVLRTSELLSAHRIDGAEQYFTRAIDYGYSFDPQEVIDKWGRDAIVGDYVRLIRTLRPDVLLTMNIQGGGGDRAHEATTVLVREAYRAAGDPARYPDQLAAGLRVWQPKKLYFAGGGGPGRGGRGAAPGAPAAVPSHVTRVDTNAYDELLGRTYSEIGTDARSNHKCQGTGSGVPPLPGGVGGRGRGGPPAGGGAGGNAGAAAPAAGAAANAGGAGAGAGARGAGAAGGPPAQAPGLTYTLMDSTMAGQMDKDEASLFDGIDVGVTSLADFAGAAPPPGLVSGLAAIAAEARRARQVFDTASDAATVPAINAGLAAVRKLRADLASFGLNDAARFEIDFRLSQEERDFQNAALAAHGLTFQAVADDGLVIAGQPVRVTILAVNHGPSDVSLSNVAVAGLDRTDACATAVVRKDTVFSCTVTGAVPAGAKLTEPYFTDTYWKSPDTPAHYTFDPTVPFGVPFAPTPFHVAFQLTADGAELTRDVPIEYRYVKDLYFGDKRMELSVVPAFSARVTPVLAVFPAATAANAKPVSREVFVSVTNGTKGAADATVTLTVPQGWTVSPSTAPLSFQNEDESLSARFVVTAPSRVAPGEYTAQAAVTSAATGSTRFTSGYQEIEYPHVQRRQVIKAAATAMKVIDVKIAPGLKVGYIMGVGDQVPPAIEQLGAQLSLIETNELAWGDLSKYDVIMTGVRAYERRADLRAYNRRLLDYATAGGTVIVQYNKTEFNQAQYGPYPASVGNGRVTDERAAVKILDPEHPAFNYPNKIGDAAWANWTQERGLYFIGQKDARYVDLVSMTDSFPDNPGEKLGALIEARVGKGRWLYVGLGLWRQLPAGTTGAYPLLANLLSLPKSPSK